MRTCQEVLQVVYQYLDNEMGSIEITEIRHHMELCRHCFSHMEFERLLRDRLRAQTNHQCPNHLKKRIQELLEFF